MATASRTLAFLLDAETLADVGDDANLSAPHSASDGNPAGSLEWLQSAGAASAGGERSRGVGAQTWESLFGIPAGSTITDVQCTGWDSITWATSNVSANGIRTRLRIVDSAGASVHTAGDLQDVSEKPSTGGTLTGHGAGTSRAVDAAAQASSTTIHFELQVSLTAVGNPTLDYEHDNIAITVTYVASVAVPTINVRQPMRAKASYR